MIIMDLEFILVLVASIATILQIWYYGNKSLAGPIWGLIGLIFWFSAMVIVPLWGTAPLNVFALVVHVRNLIKWKKESK